MAVGGCCSSPVQAGDPDVSGRQHLDGTRLGGLRRPRCVPSPSVMASTWPSGAAARSSRPRTRSPGRRRHRGRPRLSTALPTEAGPSSRWATPPRSSTRWMASPGLRRPRLPPPSYSVDAHGDASSSAVGSNSGSNNSLFTSPDGIAWTQRSDQRPPVSSGAWRAAPPARSWRWARRPCTPRRTGSRGLAGLAGRRPGREQVSQHRRLRSERLRGGGWRAGALFTSPDGATWVSRAAAELSVLRGRRLRRHPVLRVGSNGAIAQLPGRGGLDERQGRPGHTRQSDSYVSDSAITRGTGALRGRRRRDHHVAGLRHLDARR